MRVSVICYILLSRLLFVRQLQIHVQPGNVILPTPCLCRQSLFIYALVNISFSFFVFAEDKLCLLEIWRERDLSSELYKYTVLMYC